MSDASQVWLVEPELKRATNGVGFANQLLNAIPRKERRLFIAACEPVEIVFGQKLAAKGATADYAWFPTTSFISLIMPLQEGGQLEVGLVGDEGMFGASLLLGVNVSPLDAYVQHAGSALRISGTRLRRNLKQMPALDRIMKRYLYVLATQLAQSAACVRFHVIEARLARWLLMMRDRAHSDNYFITQEFLANMLGVRRVGVTKAAGALQELGLISYTRGAISIIDQEGLERAACECYLADKVTYAEQIG